MKGFFTGDFRPLLYFIVEKNDNNTIRRLWDS